MEVGLILSAEGDSFQDIYLRSPFS